MPSSSEVLKEAAAIVMGTGQHLADTLDNERNGCFEFCDGWPTEELKVEQGAIIEATVNIVGAGGDVDQDEADNLIKLAEDLSQVTAVVEAVCRQECVGAYSLFGEAEELYDDEGAPIARECPVKAKLAEAVINFGSSPS